MAQDFETTWKPVKGYEGLYEVSDTGIVRSLDRKVYGRDGVGITKAGCIIEPYNIKHGYKRIGLSRDNKRKGYLVHRLVAEAFIPNPDNLPFVNHKDENTVNNRVENLEWCNHTYNMRYSHVGERSAEKTRKPVRQYTMDGVLVAEYGSVKEASKATGASMLAICACCKKRSSNSHAKGYIWRYADDDSEVVMVYDRRIEQYSPQGQFIRVFNTQAEAARAVGVVPSAIANCLHGKSNKAGGYIWKWKTNLKKHGSAYRSSTPLSPTSMA